MFKDTENFKNFIAFVKADQQYILKFYFISFWRNTYYLKNPAYNQVILKRILRLPRFFPKKIEFFV